MRTRIALVLLLVNWVLFLITGNWLFVVLVFGFQTVMLISANRAKKEPSHDHQ